MDFSDALSGLAILGTTLIGVLTYRSSMKATDVNERASQLQWVKELRADASNARHEVTDLRSDVANLSRELGVVTREAEQLIAELQLWRRTAWRSGMTIERFREFIGPPAQSANGRPG